MTGIRAETETYYTGKPCKYGHIARRYWSTRDCVVCVKERNAKYHADDPDRSHERSLQWHKDNRARSRKQQNAYSAANREKKNADSRAWWARRGSALRRERRQAKALMASGVNTGENL